MVRRSRQYRQWRAHHITREFFSGNWNGGSCSCFTAADQYECWMAPAPWSAPARSRPARTSARRRVDAYQGGAPAAGDSFSIGPSGTRDVFSTVQA
jgi:flagellar hook-associated protein 3 FlgL